MSRGGARREHAAPERRCIATRESGDKAEMIRFVVGPEGQVVPDLAGKLPGRGLWVSARRDALAQAIKKNAFARAAKQGVTIPEGLAETVDRLLAERLISLIAMARKAGLAVAGFEKTKAALMDGAALLVQASDGSDSGKSKLRPPKGQNSYITTLDADELGLAFGRDHVIHAALLPDALTDRVRQEGLRLAGMRPDAAAGKGRTE
ncbi:RNA-binding protein [Paracoccaceae bacterium GXU_MW_L88]